MLAGLTDELTHRDRPFTGQAHTETGERGKTEIKGIRFRDLADCIVCAFVDACPTRPDEMRVRADDGTLNYNDIYELDLTGIDPLALVKNAGVRVEKMMGIYPNLPSAGEQT
jgi:hypothetical protein